MPWSILKIMKKNLLVTGAAGGIGSEIASYASKQGYRVGLMDLDNEKHRQLYKLITNLINDLDHEKL